MYRLPRYSYSLAVTAALIFGGTVALILPDQAFNQLAAAWTTHGIGGFARFVADGILCF